MQPRHRHTRRAFTFIDLMIAVAILIVAASLALTSASAMDTNILRAAAGQLVGDMEYVQSECMAHSDDPRVLTLVPAGNSYNVAKTSSLNTPITHPIDKSSFTTTYGSGRALHLAGVTLSSYSLGGDAKISFGALGQLDQTGDAAITLAFGPRTLTITWDAVTGVATIGQIH